jgi:molecular chaperone DnaK
LIEEALDEAKDKGIKIDDIKNILLVGGSTRIPAVSKMLKKKFNKDPLTGVNVDEAIALGAAIYAGKKADPSSLTATQQEELKKVELEEVSNAFYGTIVAEVNQEKQSYNDVVSIIIEKNTPLPCSKTETYFTMADGQTEVKCEVTQSVAEETNPKFVDHIWNGVLDNLPANRPAGQPIEVTYGYDDNKMMICKYKDKESGKELVANLDMTSVQKK